MGKYYKDSRTKMKKSRVSVQMWTEHFLGSEERARSFLSLIRLLENGRWIPEKWGQFEPIRRTFTDESDNEIVQAWIEERDGRVSNDIFFKRKKPHFFLSVTSWKGRVPDLNYLSFEFEASTFSTAEDVNRLKGLVVTFLLWSGAVYGTARHSDQFRYRIVPGSPLQRLDQLNWLTFFGAPYVSLIGKEHIKSCPFYSCEPLHNGLLVTADQFPDSHSMTESADRLIRLEQCLDPNVFAKADYPEIPRCRVPQFNLDETVVMP